MARLNRQQLMILALAALVDVAEQADVAPVPATLELRALLGALWILTGARDDQHWHFERFWKAVTGRRGAPTTQMLDDYCRHNDAMIAIRGIQRGLGLPDTASFDQEIRGLVHRMRARSPD